MYLIVIDAKASSVFGNYNVVQECQTKEKALNFYEEFMAHVRSSFAHREDHPYTLYKITRKDTDQGEGFIEQTPKA